MVIAGAERIAAAGQNYHSHGAVAISFVEGAMQFLFEVGRQRIHACRAIESDGRDLVFDGINQVLVAHSPSRVRARKATLRRVPMGGRARPFPAWLIRATGGSWEQIAMSIADECC